MSSISPSILTFTFLLLLKPGSPWEHSFPTTHSRASCYLFLIAGVPLCLTSSSRWFLFPFFLSLPHSSFETHAISPHHPKLLLVVTICKPTPLVAQFLYFLEYLAPYSLQHCSHSCSWCSQFPHRWLIWHSHLSSSTSLCQQSCSSSYFSYIIIS